MPHRLSEMNIGKLINNDAVFSQGKDIYNGAGLLAVYRNENVISSVVLSGRLKHQVDFEFTKKLTFDYWQCSCGKSSETEFCRHAAATLIGLQFEGDYIAGLDHVDVVEFGSESLLVQKAKYSHYAFDNFSAPLITKAANKIPLKIEIECTCNSHSLFREDSINWGLKMKAGVDRLYVVKKIAEFAAAVTTGEKLVFGKNLTYDPEVHTVAEPYRQLLAFIYMVTRLEQRRDPFDYGFNSKSIGTGNTKELMMKEASVIKGFLDRMEEIPFELTIAGCLRRGPFKVERIIEEDLALPLSIDVSRDSDAHEIMSVFMTEALDLMPLTLDGTYQLQGEKIYKFSDRHKVALKNIETLFDRYGEQLKVPENSYQDFVTKVYPSLKRDFDLVLPQAVADKVREVPVQPKVYFERANGRDVLAHIEFDYGNYEDELYIIRDLKTEDEIRQFFSEFPGDDEGYLLSGDYEMFRFTKYRLPLLRERAEVYYERGMMPLKRSFPKIQCGLHMHAGAWLEAKFEGVDLDSADLEAVYEAMRQKKDFVRLAGGSFIDLDDPEIEGHFNLIEELELTGEQVCSGNPKVSFARAIAMESRDEVSYDIDRDQRYQEVMASFKDRRQSEIQLPEHYEGILRPYQRYGFEWLVTLAEFGLGGILADDMGLGKTLQTIVFLETRILKGEGPCLVVAPTSLVYNWEEEVAKFAPDLKCLVMMGTVAERKRQRAELDAFDIIITSYSLVARDLDDYGDRIFGYCVLDEAQKIKNPLSLTAKAVKEIKAKGYLALTGTPMENNLVELWSIFDFVMPGYLHSLSDFRENHSSRGVINEATKKLKQRITPFILRRLKRDVLYELPEKIETKSVAHMTSEQQKVYMAYMEHTRQIIDQEIAEQGFGKSQVKIFSLLTRLRQICCHPTTFIDNYEGGSGKLELLQEILEEALESGHRVLIFSQFTSMLALIQEMLEVQEMTYDYLDGSTKPKARQEKVKAFNAGDTQVFLISLKAGGTGLNLTGADTVIHFDPWWNPAVEDQATDRAYRIGQKNRVQVIKLIAQNTIEEKIYDLQQRKKSMIEAIIEPGETLLSKMTEEEVLGLFE